MAMSMAHRPRCGAKTGHCCWFGENPCRFLRDDGDSAHRRWVCTLREELGSWEAVHADPRYVEHVNLKALLGVDCGDYPGPGMTCGECGVTGG